MEAHALISDYVGSGFIYIFTFWKKLRWGDDCNMWKRCPLQVTCELGIDMWQRQRDFYNMCMSIFVQECYFCLALAASANFMHTLTISSSLPPDHACPPPPSCLSCHLSSTFVWFTVIRCEAWRLLLLLIHHGLCIIETHAASTPALLSLWDHGPD